MEAECLEIQTGNNRFMETFINLLLRRIGPPHAHRCSTEKGYNLTTTAIMHEGKHHWEPTFPEKVVSDLLQ